MNSQPADDGPLTLGEQKRLRRIVFGNGHGEIGLDEEMRSIKGVLFFNKRTGEAGMVQDMRDVKRMVAQMRAIWWAVGAAVVLMQALQAFGVIGRG